MKNYLFIMLLICPNFVLAAAPEDLGTTRYVLSGILGTYPGFGLGHAIQSRYLEKGWIFTAGEGGFAVLGIVGLAECGTSAALFSTNSCNSNSKLLAGMAGFLVFKVWEIIDVWSYYPKTGSAIITRPQSPQIYVGIAPQDNGATAFARVTY